MKTHLISYGDEKYASQKEFFKETALASGFFDEIMIYGPQDIDAIFYEQFQIFLNQHKGGGFWIWKPYLIKKVLDSLPLDDILIYCDAGCMINSRGIARFKEYITLLSQSDKGCIAFELPHREFEFTKQEVLDYFGASAEIADSNQLMATIILFKKSDHATLLVDKWCEALYDKPLLFADDKKRSIQNEKFIDHRHDQSVFSVIRKTYGAEIIPDETYFLDFIREGQAYPFWATRLK